MTRKQALARAIELIDDEEVKNKLKEINDWFPLTRWSKEAIMDAVDQFILDAGRVPTMRDFSHNRNLPPHKSVKACFGIEVREFLDKYYPVKRLCDTKKYYNKSKEAWLLIFKENYIAVKPRSGDMYNDKRDKATPSWRTVAKMFGIKNWTELLSLAGLDRYDKRGRTISSGAIIVVSCYSAPKNNSELLPVIEEKQEPDIVDVIDVVDDYIKVHRHAPSADELKRFRGNVPVENIVRDKMKMTLQEFLDKFYSHVPKWKGHVSCIDVNDFRANR